MVPFLIIVCLLVGLIIWISNRISTASKIRREQIKQSLLAEANSYIENIKQTKSMKPIATQIMLKKGELAYLECQCTLKETRSVRYFQSDRVGFRVAKGVYLGKTSGTSQSQQELKTIDTGTLTLTNKRLIFNGVTNDKVVQLEKLIAANPYLDAMEISTETRQKSMLFTVPNSLIWCSMVKLLNSVPDPQDLSTIDLSINFSLEG
jgi:hypothetical protein